MGWIFLFLAIILELAGTVTMKFSHGLTNLYPSIFMFVFYGFSFSSLSLALKYVDVSIAYAVWSGLGTVFIALAGFYMFNEQMTVLKMISISIIIIGVIGLNWSGRAHTVNSSSEIDFPVMKTESNRSE